MKEILPALSADSAVPPRVASGSDECRESSETGIQSSCVRKAEILLTELLKQHDAGENPDWELLRGLPGMRLEPMPWNEAVEVVRDGTSVALARLGRMPLQSKHYREFRDGVILQEYVSVTDYLYATVFGLDCKQNSGRHGKLQALVPDEFHAGEPVIVWRRNDFPYAFETGIEHHVLWSSQPLTEDRIQQEILFRRPRDQYEFIFFINPTVLKSVPAIWHAHIISRKIVQH